MVKKLEEQVWSRFNLARRIKEKYISLTDLGWAQKEIGDRVSRNWVRFSVKDFRIKKSKFEEYQTHYLKSKAKRITSRERK